jgi:hypothetical protein
VRKRVGKERTRSKERKIKRKGTEWEINNGMRKKKKKKSNRLI